MTCPIETCPLYGRLQGQLSEHVDFIGSQILSEKLDLWDVPFKVRSTAKIYYIYSFRRYRNFSRPDDRRGYARTLDILAEDIAALGDDDFARQLRALHDSYALEPASE